MFCPPGYVVLQRVEYFFRAKASLIHPMPSDELRVENLTLYETARDRVRSYRALDRDAAISRFLLTCPSLSVCSTSGVVLRIAPAIASWEPGNGSAEFNGFWFIDRKNWTADTSRASKWVEGKDQKLQKLSTQLSIARGLKKDKDASLILEKINIIRFVAAEVKALVKALQPFNGFSVTILESHAPISTEMTSEFFGYRQPSVEEDDENAIPRVGRPRKQGIALGAYWKIYPSGHGELKWKEVTRAVTDMIGQPIGADTLRRALGLRS